MLRHNQAPRYFIYMIGIFCIFASILWQTPFVAGSATTDTRVMRALYASLSFPLYLVGVSMILMPALAGKAQAFRWFYGSQTWTMFSHMSIGMYYFVPVVAIFYYLGTQH